MPSPESPRTRQPGPDGPAHPPEAQHHASPTGQHPPPHRIRAAPILREAGWDGRLPRARAHVAVVVVYQRGDHQVVWPHQRNRVPLHRRPTTIYEIDLGLHRTVITADLPSRDRAASFHASISVQWRVLDPSGVVRHQVLDIDETLSAALLRRARRLARDFRIDQVTAAEDEINDRLGGVDIDVTAAAGIQQAMRDATERGCLGAEYGLWTRAITHLTLDEAATEHNAKMMQLSWAIEEEETEQKLRIIKDGNEQAITAARVAVYREIIAAGDAERFALRLASHPESIADITAVIREDQLTSRHDTIDFIKRMVDSGVVERWEVSDQVREALSWLKEATARVMGDTDHRIPGDDRPVPQRRRGRGTPIEEETDSSPPPPQVIIVKPEERQVPEHGQTEQETARAPLSQ